MLVDQMIIDNTTPPPLRIMSFSFLKMDIFRVEACGGMKDCEIYLTVH